MNRVSPLVFFNRGVKPITCLLELSGTSIALASNTEINKTIIIIWRCFISVLHQTIRFTATETNPPKITQSYQISIHSPKELAESYLLAKIANITFGNLSAFHRDLQHRPVARQQDSDDDHRHN